MKILVRMFKELEHVKMFQNGELYCNPISFFTKIEDHTGRKDNFDGKVPQPEIISISLNKIKYNLKDPIINPPLYSLGSENINLYCMSLCELQKISEKGYSLILNEEITKLGPHLVYISNDDEFFRRFHLTMKSENYKFKYGPIKYYNIKKPPTIGEINKETAFYKSDFFEKQQEFRFVIKAKTTKPQSFIVNIGYIRDITAYLNIDEIIKSSIK